MQCFGSRLALDLGSIEVSKKGEEETQAVLSASECSVLQLRECTSFARSKHRDTGQEKPGKGAIDTRHKKQGKGAIVTGHKNQEKGSREQIMKREGLIHGSSVRVSRQAWGPANGHRPSRKPTSASKCHQKKVTGGNVYISKDSVAKSTSSYKAKGMDINKNLLMTDWSVRKRRLQCDHLFGDDSASGSDYEDDDDFLEESHVRDGRDDAEIVLSLDSLIVERRRKSPSTGSQQALSHGAFAQPSGHLRFVSGDELGVDETWWGLDLLDEEIVADDWILLDEAHGQEGFSLFSVNLFD